MRLHQRARKRTGKAGGPAKGLGRRLSTQGPESMTRISECSSNYNRKPPKFSWARQFQKIILTVMWRINWRGIRVEWK